MAGRLRKITFTCCKKAAVVHNDEHKVEDTVGVAAAGGRRCRRRRTQLVHNSYMQWEREGESNKKRRQANTSVSELNR